MDAKSFYKTAGKAALEAGQYQKSKFGTKLNIEFKGTVDLVTEVDKNSEAMIIKNILAAHPDHNIMGEEGGGQVTDSDYKWIIDPLDGTTNYAHSYPVFGVSIALEYKKEIIGGLVFNPMHAELFRGFKDDGAYLNDKPIQVSKAPKLINTMLATGFAYNIRETLENNLNHFKNMLLATQAVRRDGSAAMDLCYVACGRYDGFWELNLYPWDTAAGMLIALEAGATVTRFDGSSYTVYDKDIVISNTKIHDEMVAILKKGI